MKVRIGIAETGKVVEVDVDDAAAFERTLEESYASGAALLWFEDDKRRRFGIPRDRLGYVEIETSDQRPSVGFGPG